MHIENLLKEYINKDNEMISNLANISAILYSNLKEINWIGFYMADNENEILTLGPFQGLQAVAKIDFKNGVCGKCATKKEVIVVEDVHCFEGHIACDIRSKSEIVLPIMNQDGTLYGVLDVDSPIKNRFTSDEKKTLENIVKVIENLL